MLAAASERTGAFYYRTSGGAEIDLLLVLPGGAVWAIEIKRSMDPRPSRGFHEACDDLRPAERMVLYPGNDSFPIAPNGCAGEHMGVVWRARVRP